MKNRRDSIVKFDGIADCLLHGRLDVEPLHALTFDMYTRQADTVRHGAIGHRAAALYIITIGRQHPRKFTLCRRSLAGL